MSKIKKVFSIVIMFFLFCVFSMMAQEIKPTNLELIDLGKNVKLEMVLIQPGTFKMGSKKTIKITEKMKPFMKSH